MQLYVADYLGDTYHLTTEEHGAYLLLIMTYWQSGKSIHKSRLATASRMTNERWTDVERTLNEFFVEDENGCWVHERIELDLNRVNAKAAQASRAGKASAKKRKASKVIDNKGNSNGRSTDVQRKHKSSLNHTDTDTDTDTKDREKEKPLNNNLRTSVQDGFIPSEQTKQKAILAMVPKEIVNSPDEIIKFISHQKSAGKLSFDWNEEFLKWLMNAKVFSAKRGKKNEANKPSYPKPETALDRSKRQTEEYLRKLDAGEIPGSDNYSVEPTG